MSAEEKPLHVQVAEALGWRDEAHSLPEWVGARPVVAWGYTPSGAHSLEPPPRYDTDWAVTGPLIEKLGLGVFLFRAWRAGTFTWQKTVVADGWQVEIEDDTGVGWGGNGETPLLAVCRLVVTLHEKRPEWLKDLLA